MFRCYIGVFICHRTVVVYAGNAFVIINLLNDIVENKNLFLKRPYIIVENQKPRLKQIHIEQLNLGQK